jgi:hypothetical protein
MNWVPTFRTNLNNRPPLDNRLCWILNVLQTLPLGCRRFSSWGKMKFPISVALILAAIQAGVWAATTDTLPSCGVSYFLGDRRLLTDMT